MLGIGGRAAIATGQHLAATGHADQDGLHGRGDGLAERLRGLVFQVCAVDEMLLYTLLKHGGG